MAVTFGSGATSLSLQRGISRADALANRSLERLSTGMRINHASDDAAGLAVSMSLNSSQRIYNQAVRNANDAISLTNISSGALDSIQVILDRIGREQGAMGAFQSRLATELETLQSRSDNYSAAASRITDADIAEETASLTRAGILRQASATVASQANQQPRIALDLLRNI